MEKCFACDKKFKDGSKRYLVDTRDSQTVFVGPDCYKKVLAAGEDGYLLPPDKDKFQSGLRLFRCLYPIKND